MGYAMSELHDWVSEQIDRGVRARFWGEDGPVTDGGEDDFTIDDAAKAVEAAQAYASAAGEVARVLKELLAQHLESQGASAFVKGNTVYRFAPKKTLKVHDPKRLADYLMERNALTRVVRIDGSSVRISELRKVVDEFLHDKGSDAWRTFADYEDGPPTVTAIPLDRAPKYLQDMKDGEVR